MKLSDKENFDVAISLTHAARTSTTNGTAVDLQGFASGTFVFNPQAWTDGSHAMSIEHSDASGSGFAAVDASLLDGTAPTITAGGGQLVPTRVGYLGNKRYVRAVQTVTGSPSTGAIIGAQVIRGQPRKGPK
jgi:hypothetical protein